MRTLGVVLMGLVLCTGCDIKAFFGNTVSQSELEDALKKWLDDHHLEATDIHCPDDAKMETGNTFECNCTVHGTVVPVAVRVKDASTGLIEWEPKYLTMKGEEFAKDIHANPAFKDHEVSVTCEDEVLVSIPESVWSCEVVDKNDGNKTYKASVTFTDGEGGHKFDLNES